MKKFTLFALTVLIALILTACAGRRVSEVVSIDLVGWTPAENYDFEETVSLAGVSILVTYQDGSTETLPLNSPEVSIRGTGVEFDENDNLILKTDDTGSFQIRITYGGVTLNLNYSVFNLGTALFVGPEREFDTLQAALASIDTPNTETIVIFVDDFEYVQTTQLNISVDNVTIIGESEEFTIIKLPNPGVTFSGNEAVSITGDNVTIMNLTFKQTNVPSQGNQLDYLWFVKVSGNSNFTLENVTIEGPGRFIQKNGAWPEVPYDWNSTLGGLDLHTVTTATIHNVSILNVSRNAFSFSSTSNITLTDFYVESSGHLGGSAVALYHAGGTAPLGKKGTSPSTIIEMTGSMYDVGNGVNVESPSQVFSGFQFGDVIYENINSASMLITWGDESDSQEGADFAVNVFNSPWRVRRLTYRAGGWNEHLTEAYFFLTQQDAQDYADSLDGSFVVIDGVDVPVLVDGPVNVLD